MSTIGERTKVSLTVVGLASLLLGVAGGFAGAVTTGHALKEQVVPQVREGRRRELASYVTRGELAVARERDRDRPAALRGCWARPGVSASSSTA